MQSRALPRQKAVLFLSKRIYSMFPHQISYVVVAQSSRRSPARIEVVSSNPVEVEFFFLFFFLLPNRSETSGSVS